MRGLALAGLLWLLPGLLLAQDAAARLAEAMRLSDVVVLLREEGLDYAAFLDEDMLEGSGGAYYREQVSTIYAGDAMQAALTEALRANMSEAALSDTLAFFDSPLGQKITSLELSARSAFDDPDVEAAAIARYASLPKSDTRLKLVREYVEANELVARNIVGLEESDFKFYLGLVDGGVRDRDDEGFLSGLLENRDETRRETLEWAMSFHLLAYHPLTKAELQANIDFSHSDSGRDFNDAIFIGFDTMYEDIFYRLGRLVARSIKATDL